MQLASTLNVVDDPMLMVDPEQGYVLEDYQSTCRDLREQLIEKQLLDEARKSLEIVATPGTRERRVLDNLLADHPNPTWVGVQ